MLFKPRIPPDAGPPNPRGRIAVVGAGLTGISTAAHCISHGFDVVLYDENESVGGIWSHVNSTSGLQLNSLLYRFFPSVQWSKAFPLRDEILEQIRQVWEQYHLAERTRLRTKVTAISRHSELSTDPKELGHARWVVNDGADGVFDAVFCTIGTCGAPNMVDLKDKDKYGGRIVHSSDLDSLKPEEIKGRKIVVVGSGASGVEAVELAVAKGADDVKIVARDDKWIIPRNIVFDTLLSMQPLGRPLSFIPEWVLKTFHYRDLECIAPPPEVKFYAGTPIVNDAFLEHIREGKVQYIRGDTAAYTPSGVHVNVRGVIGVEKSTSGGDPKLVSRTFAPSSPPTSSSQHKTLSAPLIKGGSGIDAGQGGRFTTKGTEGEEQDISADIVVIATGFHQPPVDFLPEDLFPEGYARPDLYLQNFSTEDWSVVLTNAAYKSAIGTNARPLPDDLKLWVNIVKFLKRGSPGGALSFFTYMELTIWVVTFMFFRPERLKWAFFILFGWGVY
ncbi:FAD/NAD(P)-binding domain-containing protein [Clavulina sp. PMI_390]|nr:FAD/NAD(P)-binding domain-containing protein [Clavulina sp. PMI_390]